MREKDDSSRVYLDGGRGQDLRETRTGGAEPTPLGEIPFCIGIVGDFSGRGTRPETDSHRDIPHRRIHRLTPERVMSLAGLTPRIQVSGLPHGLPDQTISFSSMEDFHPDEIFRRMDVFGELREARAAASAGEVIGGVTGPDQTRDTGGDNSAPTPSAGDDSSNAGGHAGPATDSSSLLDAVLGQTERDADRGAMRGTGPDTSRNANRDTNRDPNRDTNRDTNRKTEPPAKMAEPPAPPGSPLNEDLDAFLRRVVAPYSIKPSADLSGLIEDLDAEAGRIMRAVMHSPAFKDLESLWRGVLFLMSRIQVSTNLRVYLIDVSERELVADLLSTDEPTEWGFAHTLLNPVSEHGEDLRWAALLGGFQFGNDPLHVPLLQRIGLLCESGGVPWFGAADPVLLGASSLEEAPEPRDWTESQDPLWEELRQKPEAEWISLSLPGFLLRPPYGPGGRKVNQFRFQEAVNTDAVNTEAGEDDAGGSEATEGAGAGLWGNPAFLMGVAMAEEFTRSGWGLRLTGRYSLSQLPTLETADGGVACLQARFSHSGATGALERGLSPVVGPRHEAEVHFGAPTSISTSRNGVRAWWADSV